MLVGVRGQNPTFNIFLIFIDNVLNSNVVLGLKNDQVSVSEKKKKYSSNADRYFQFI